MKNFCSWWNLLIEIFQINDLGELGILKQRTSYVTARSPGLLVLSSHEDPSQSSCCGEIRTPLCHFWHCIWTLSTALSEGTVLSAVVAAGNAIVLLHIFKAQDSSFHSPVSTRLGLIPGQGRMHGFLSENPVEAFAWTIGTTVLALVCVCVVFFTPTFFSLNSLSCLFIHSTKMHWVPPLSWAPWQKSRGGLRLWLLHEGGYHLASRGPCSPTAFLCHTDPIGRDLRNHRTQTLCCSKGVKWEGVSDLPEVRGWALTELEWKQVACPGSGTPGRAPHL